MSELYDRAAVLEVGPAGGSGVKIDSRGDLVDSGEGLRIAFDITKTIQSSANKARIQVYSLAQATRDRISKGDVVRLRVGYQDALELAYEGEVSRSQSGRAGPEIVTTIECGDGVEAFKAQDCKRTFPAGTTVSAVVQAVARRFTEALPDDKSNPVTWGPTAKRKTKAARLSTRTLAQDLAALERGLKLQGFSTVLRRSMSVAGNARDVMDALARMWRFDWSVQDGALQAVGYGASLVGSATMLSSATGLLGIPEVTNFGVKVTALLIPTVRPGAMLKLQSATATGQYRVETVHLQGDTRGQGWTVEAEARSL